MNAVARWLKDAEAIYMAEDRTKLFERASRIQGEVDRVVFIFQVLCEIRAIRSALEQAASETPRPAKEVMR